MTLALLTLLVVCAVQAQVGRDRSCTTPDGLDGVCVRTNRCTQDRLQLTTSIARCPGGRRRRPKICCPKRNRGSHGGDTSQGGGFGGSPNQGETTGGGFNPGNPWEAGIGGGFNPPETTGGGFNPPGTTGGFNPPETAGGFNPPETAGGGVNQGGSTESSPSQGGTSGGGFNQGTSRGGFFGGSAIHGWGFPSNTGAQSSSMVIFGGTAGESFGSNIPAAGIIPDVDRPTSAANTGGSVTGHANKATDVGGPAGGSFVLGWPAGGGTFSDGNSDGGRLGGGSFSGISFGGDSESSGGVSSAGSVNPTRLPPLRLPGIESVGGVIFGDGTSEGHSVGGEAFTEGNSNGAGISGVSSIGASSDGNVSSAVFFAGGSSNTGSFGGNLGDQSSITGVSAGDASSLGSNGTGSLGNVNPGGGGFNRGTAGAGTSDEGRPGSEEILPDLTPLNGSAAKLVECGVVTPLTIYSRRRRRRQTDDIGPFDTKIIGGKNAQIGKWPWIALIGNKQGSKPSFFFCGGTLIDRQHVLTAAHCLKPRATDTTKLVIRLGEYDTKSEDDGASPEDYGVASFTNHENFLFPVLHDDISLIKLDRPVEYTDLIKPICLPPGPSDDYAGQRVDVAGWGYTEFGGEASNILQEVELPVVAVPECQSKYEGSTSFQRQFPGGFGDTKLCAAEKLGGKDACQGDSGGPMVRRLENGRYELIGVVSAGVGCGSPGFPGLYTRVSAYLDWMQNNKS